MLWPPDAKGWLTGKDPDAGKDWGQEEKGTTEDEMARCHHQLNGHGFGWTLGVGDGQGGLVCCSPWGHKELDATEWLNWTDRYRKTEMNEEPFLISFRNYFYILYIYTLWLYALQAFFFQPRHFHIVYDSFIKKFFFHFSKLAVLS